MATIRKSNLVPRENEVRWNILNLTWHDINILFWTWMDLDFVIESDGIARLNISTTPVENEFNLPLVRREVKELILPENISYEDIRDADAVIVSAQMVEYMKKEFPSLKILTVWETVRTMNSDWKVSIHWARNLVLN